MGPRAAAAVGGLPAAGIAARLSTPNRQKGGLMTRPLLSVYGLKWNPFTPDLPADALWRTPEIEHFCWRVEQQVRDGGFALITGASGTGKSITLRLLPPPPQTMPDVVCRV